MVCQQNPHDSSQAFPYINKHKQAETADQVGDGVKFDELIHLQIIESTWCSNHYVHPALHQVDLAFPIPSTVDTDTERRCREIVLIIMSTHHHQLQIPCSFLTKSQQKTPEPLVAFKAVLFAFSFNLQGQFSCGCQDQNAWFTVLGSRAEGKEYQNSRVGEKKKGEKISIITKHAHLRKKLKSTSHLQL